MHFHRLAATLAAAAMLVSATPGTAQTYLPDSATPFAPPPALTDAERAAVVMPALAYREGPEDAKTFDKYYYFHRADTDFATAYADIVECDGYARGLQSGIGYMQTPYPYAGTMAGALGGAIGNALAAAIFGSAEKRRLRRINMRTCMHYKGYSRYGLPKSTWEPFNFEEGLSGVSQAERDKLLRQQALVAASGTTQGRELGL